MFTGIIEEIGNIKYKNSSKLKLEVGKISEGICIGDSIAVNGVCLTVTENSANTITLDIMNETLSRSNLGLLNTGCNVNLERAMSANGRFGGHIVSGHIDGTGKITHIKKDGIAQWYTISADDTILKGIVMKGSVALDGISLTVANVGSSHFSVSVIPHTLSETTLLEKRIGDIINIETDLIGKYVERLLTYKANNKPLDMELLIKNGF